MESTTNTYKSYEHEFSVTQEYVMEYAALTGDFNPLHTSEEYASKTAFQKPIIHGMLSLSIFSKILGVDFPGAGTVIMKVETDFKRPMFAGTNYKAKLAISEINTRKNLATLLCSVTDLDKNKVTITGTIVIMYPQGFEPLATQEAA